MTVTTVPTARRLAYSIAALLAAAGAAAGVVAAGPHKAVRADDPFACVAYEPINYGVCVYPPIRFSTAPTGLH